EITRRRSRHPHRPLSFWLNVLAAKGNVERWIAPACASSQGSLAVRLHV
ncbi:unnamed protein product, partial [Tetraodon nigroviridis]